MANEKAALESIPHICKRICAIWGSPELENYINTLVMDSRDGKRSGFPVDFANELMWLVEFNKLRRAIDLSCRLNISLADARIKLDNESTAGSVDAWSDPLVAGSSKGRRHADNPQLAHSPRRQEDKAAGGIIFRLLTHKFVLIAIILILSLKNIWPYIKAMF